MRRGDGEREYTKTATTPARQIMPIAIIFLLGGAMSGTIIERYTPSIAKKECRRAMVHDGSVWITKDEVKNSAILNLEHV